MSIAQAAGSRRMATPGGDLAAPYVMAFDIGLGLAAQGRSSHPGQRDPHHQPPTIRSA